MAPATLGTEGKLVHGATSPGGWEGHGPSPPKAQPGGREGLGPSPPDQPNSTQQQQQQQQQQR